MIGVMPLQKIERAAQAGQHAEPEHVDLENAQRVEIVLVPFDDGALLHRGVLDRHDIVEPAAGDDESADMLGEMAGKADQFAGERERLGKARIGRIESGAARMLVRDRLRRPAPQRAGERADRVLRQAENLADLADGAAPAIADHGRGKPRALASVTGIDVLDHLLAPLVLEIDVDVGRLAPFGRDEALEQKIRALGIDLGDAEAVADGGVRGGAAALAENALRAGKPHDVMHGEEIGRVVQFADERVFVVEGMADFRRHAVRIAPARALLGEGDERFLRGGETRADFVRILVGEFVEREAAACEEAQRLGDRLRRGAEQARHLVRRFQVALGIRFETAAGRVESEMRADAGDDVLQRAPLGRVVEHVAYRDERHIRRSRERGEAREPAGVVAAIEHARAEPHRARRRFAQAEEDICRDRFGVRAVQTYFPSSLPGLTRQSIFPPPASLRSAPPPACGEGLGRGWMRGSSPRMTSY